MADNKQKHYLRLSKAMNGIIGRERSSELLPLMRPVNDEENAEVNYQWAMHISTLLENHLSEEEGIKVREQ